MSCTVFHMQPLTCIAQLQQTFTLTRVVHIIAGPCMHSRDVDKPPAFLPGRTPQLSLVQLLPVTRERAANEDGALDPATSQLVPGPQEEGGKVVQKQIQAILDEVDDKAFDFQCGNGGYGFVACDCDVDGKTGTCRLTILGADISRPLQV